MEICSNLRLFIGKKHMRIHLPLDPGLHRGRGWNEVWFRLSCVKLLLSVAAAIRPVQLPA